MCCGERPGPRPRALLHALCALRALRGCGAVCVACASSPLPQISHIISLGQYSTTLTNVGIARGQFQNWKESQGNYVRHCWGTMKVSDTSGQDYSEQPSQNKRSKNPDPSKQPGTTGVEGTGGSGEPGRGAGGRRRAKLAAQTARGRAAAHGHTKQPGLARHIKQPSPNTQAAPGNTSGATSTSHMTSRVCQRGGYRSTRPLSVHSATASARLKAG